MNYNAKIERLKKVKEERKDERGIYFISTFYQ